MTSSEAEESFRRKSIQRSRSRKHLVRVPGKHEIDRIADRRPRFYQPLVAPNGRDLSHPRRYPASATKKYNGGGEAGPTEWRGGGCRVTFSAMNLAAALATGMRSPGTGGGIFIFLVDAWFTLTSMGWAVDRNP